MLSRYWTAAAAVASLALAGCGTASTAGTTGPAAETTQGTPLQLNDTSWMMKLPKNSQCEVPPMMEFSSGRASGDLGCNRFDGAVKIDGSRIEFDQVAVTMKMCAPQYMALESQMLNVINNARSARQTKDALTFFDADGKELLTMVPEVAGACD